MKKSQGGGTIFVNNVWNHCCFVEKGITKKIQAKHTCILDYTLNYYFYFVFFFNVPYYAQNALPVVGMGMCSRGRQFFHTMTLPPWLKNFNSKPDFWDYFQALSWGQYQPQRIQSFTLLRKFFQNLKYIYCSKNNAKKCKTLEPMWLVLPSAQSLENFLKSRVLN